VDLRAVKAATIPQLATYAIASARNAQDLLHDAEVLAVAGCRSRAYSIAALAVEECGKTAALTALAAMPKNLRARAPVGRMLEWHQLKQVGGMMLGMAPVGCVASKILAMPAAEVAQLLRTLDAPAEEADRLKQRGFYVDMDRAGRIREPSEITKAELDGLLSRARQAAASAGVLLTPDAHARLTHPSAEQVQGARAMVSALIEDQGARSPEAAVAIMQSAASKIR
jgi:AbiV family abortive infection protein